MVYNIIGLRSANTQRSSMRFLFVRYLHSWSCSSEFKGLDAEVGFSSWVAGFRVHSVSWPY